MKSIFGFNLLACHVNVLAKWHHVMFSGVYSIWAHSELLNNRYVYLNNYEIIKNIRNLKHIIRFYLLEKCNNKKFYIEMFEF